MEITVPICNLCGLPHFGRIKKEDRCQCDCSGQFHYEEIEEEVILINGVEQEFVKK